MASDVILGDGKVWSDGIHTVRPASEKDPHPLKWVVMPRPRVGATMKKRHIATYKEGVTVAIRATELLLAASSPEDRERLQGHIAAEIVRKTPKPAPAPVAAPAKPEPVKEAKPKPVKPKRAPAPKREKARETAAIDTDKITSETRVFPKFSTQMFNCRFANSVAQVWERSAVLQRSSGRRRKDGKAANPTYAPHMPGECAVLRGDEPVRDEDGTVRVFKNWMTALEHADELWATAGENERFTKGPVVYANLKVQVVFCPEESFHRPFYLWLPDYNRPVWINREASTAGTRPKEVSQEQWARVRKLSRAPTLESTKQRFRTITEAIKTADEIAMRIDPETFFIATGRFHP